MKYRSVNPHLLYSLCGKMGGRKRLRVLAQKVFNKISSEVAYVVATHSIRHKAYFFEVAAFGYFLLTEIRKYDM